MQTQCRPEQLVFAPVEGRSVVASFTGGVITSDAGALLLGATDRAIDLVKRFAACFQDARDPDLIEHTLATLVGQRVFGIALGYEDLVDHDQLLVWCTDRLAGAEELSGVGERPLSCPWIPIVPFKLNQDRRHHIPRQRRKVTNWPAYDASLRQRGSLTVWFTEEAVEAWAAEPRTTRGGQPWYSALAILTALVANGRFA